MSIAALPWPAGTLLSFLAGAVAENATAADPLLTSSPAYTAYEGLWGGGCYLGYIMAAVMTQAFAPKSEVEMRRRRLHNTATAAVISAYVVLGVTSGVTLFKDGKLDSGQRQGVAISLAFFTSLADGVVLAWVTAIVNDALAGGQGSLLGLVWWGVAVGGSVVQLVLASLAASIASAGTPEGYAATYLYASCGGGCQSPQGSTSWYQRLSILSFPCTTPWVDPVLALSAILRVALAVSVCCVAALRCMQQRKAGYRHPVTPSTYGTGIMFSVAPGSSRSGIKCSVATAAYAALVLVVYLQPALVVGWSAALPLTCSCVVASGACTVADDVANKIHLQLVGRFGWGYAPSIALLWVTCSAAGGCTRFYAGLRDIPVRCRRTCAIAWAAIHRIRACCTRCCGGGHSAADDGSAHYYGA